MTSVEPTPAKSGDAAFSAALKTEYAVIYGYGMVSAYSAPELNELVSTAIHQHRDRRDRAIAMLTVRSITVPVPAAGYQLPGPLTDSDEAVRLASLMENDAAVAWRAVVEQSDEPTDREFAATALSQSAVLAAQWNRTAGRWPFTTAFPGGQD